uniref:Glycolipid transfer protein domain-containing protein n=1 Tax=Arion vulgaris TaxID=1028688 RepID=A0A0B6ZMY2_9EUPU
MLESTGDVPQCSSKTMFGIITKFDPVQGRVIQTEHFLQACKELTNILDCLGTSFLLAKKDIMGNIKKIEEQFQTRPCSTQL